MFALKRFRVLVWLPLLLVLASPAVAQTTPQRPDTAAKTAAAVATPPSDSGLQIPSDAVWFLTVDVKRFVENPVGQQALQILEQLIREETNDFDEMLDLKTARAKIGRVIGFDPLGGIASVKMYGMVSPFAGEIRNEEEIVEKMATTGIAVVTLTGGTGNLEGLALATPDYRSTEYKGATIHSGTLPDFPLRVYMAVLKQQEARQPAIVVFGLDEDQLKQALDQVKGRRISGQVGVLGSSRAGAPANVLLPAAKGTLLAAGVKLDEATIRAVGVPEQQSAVVRMFTRLAVSLGAEDDSVTVQLTAEVVNEERAEQVRQLAQGAIAFLQLPIEEFEEQEEFRLLRKILEDVEVSRQGTYVHCRLTKPADTLLKDLMNEWTRQMEGARREDAEEDARREDAEEGARREDAEMERARARRAAERAKAAAARQKAATTGEADDAEERAPDGKSLRP